MERGRTRVSYERTPNFCDRVGKSLIGILVGIVLLLIATVLVFWNEGRAVQTAKSLEEGLQQVVHLKNPYVISQENDGRLIHLIAPLRTNQMLEDRDYEVAVQSVKLRRVVEMYQWDETVTERKYDDGNGQTRVEKEYSYNQVWRPDVIRSNGFDDSFNHMNPSEISVSRRSYEAERVNVGEFLLSPGLKGKINNYQQLPLRGKHFDKDTKIYNNYFYHGHDPYYPQIGDIRVMFEYAGLSGDNSDLEPPAQVSVIARQMGQKLLPFQTLAGDTLEILYIGKLSAQEIFGKEKMQNSVLTWGIRFGGWLLMLAGFACLTSIITTIVDWLPIVRNLVAMGVCMMNLSLSISWSLTVIAIGWIFYRPLLGIAILAMACTPFFVSKFTSQGSRRRVD